MALRYFELQMRGSEVKAALEAALSAYQKPGVGIPLADLAEAVQTAINSIAGKYVKPENGIPATDLASAVQTALASISGKYVKPENGIPASDLAAGVIPDVSEFVTRAVNDLMNYYLKSETYTKSEVQALIDAVKQFSYEVVAELPTASASTMHKIYLVPSTNPKTKNVKDEYITIESSGSYSWEQIGTTTIDLSNYVTSQALQTALADYATTAAMTLALAGKMDKVAGATAGNIAVLDSAGEVKELPAGTEGQVLTQGENGAEWTDPEGGELDDDVTKTSANAVKSSGIYSAIHPANGSSQPAGGMLPNVLYNLGELSGSVTIAFATPTDNTIANHYFFTFSTGATAPSITFPASITSWMGGSAPTINANKHYEISVLGGVGVAMEV